MKIEAEGLELILANEQGDHVIIPKKHRAKVQEHIKNGNHEAIDDIVSTLPVMEDYAEDGTLIPGHLYSVIK